MCAMFLKENFCLQNACHAWISHQWSGSCKFVNKFQQSHLKCHHTVHDSKNSQFYALTYFPGALPKSNGEF